MDIPNRQEWRPIVLSLCAAVIITGLGIRICEYLLTSANYILPDTSLSLFAGGLAYDLLYYSMAGVVFSLLYLLVALLNGRIAFWITSSAVWLFFILNVGLITYYSEVLTPLGADFFAYNMVEVSDTVQTSIDITVGRVFPFILFPALFSLTFYFLRKFNLHRRVINGGSGLVLTAAAAWLFLYPSDSDYDREIDYTLTVNKSAYFLSGSYGHFFPGAAGPAYSGPEYPLLKDSDVTDVLGAYFNTGSTITVNGLPGTENPNINSPNTAERPPNIVFVIVESLGGTLMPPNDNWGGFTPFLDSLAAESLNWTHFLATSGRSFNAQPSIFGSLPYGDQGFMEMGYLAPDHHSLISVLNANGYHTAYFCGYESRFDKLDQFLERENIDFLMDASRFPDDYQKMDEIEGGFTWGYSDKDTFRRAFDFLDTMDMQTPRLDIYFTLNFHEPFIIPETEAWQARFRERLLQLELPAAKSEEMEQYESIFSALLYTDDAIRELLERYKEREDYEDTIFIITGDHRMIPIPHTNRIDRYYVPFMIYSPMLSQPATFQGVSSHLDVTPTLLSFLENNYGLATPDSVHWLGQELNTGAGLTDGRSIPFMRNKNEMPDYLSGNLFLSGDQLFELEEGMRLRSLQDPERLQDVSSEFEQFKSLNSYVTSANKLLRITDEMATAREQLLDEELFFQEQNLGNVSVEELYTTARELAFTEQYGDARTILRKILRERPNFHDARLLFGRTYGWEELYEEAEEQFNEVMRRNPDLLETYSAKADLHFWKSEPELSLEMARLGLQLDNDHIPLLFRMARAYWQNGEFIRARDVADRALILAPDNEELIALRNRL